MKKNIDVIIPVRDRKDLLILALDSINNQKLIPSKVIVVDDCSKSKIFINKRYKFPIKIIRNKINKGASFSRNKGALISKNKYLTFLDSDDVWTKDKLSFQHKWMKKHNLEFFSSDVSFLNKNFENNKKKLIYHFLELNSFPNPSSMIFKRKSFIKLGGFNEKLRTCEDNDLWLKILFSKLKILVSKNHKVKINKFSREQISRNFFLRNESVQKFLDINKKYFVKYLDVSSLKKFCNNYAAKAYIPILKNALFKFDIKVLFLVILKLMNKKFFYKRLFNFFLKKSA
jgi:glycosyltransferase involved in cell wall biosynthesis